MTWAMMGYSISYEKINKKWNGRLRTSLRAAAFKEASSTYFTAFPLRKQSFDLKNLKFGPISFLFIHLMIIRCRGFVKRVVVVLFSFPALSVRHLVTHLRACAAYKLVRFTAGAKCPWFLVVQDDFMTTSTRTKCEILRTPVEWGSCICMSTVT